MEKTDWDDWWPRLVWVGECFFWYRLTRVVPDKFHRAVKWLCVCVLLADHYSSSNIHCRLWQRMLTLRGRAAITPTYTSRPLTRPTSTSRKANSLATLTSAQQSSCSLRRLIRLSLPFGRASVCDTARASAPRSTNFTYLLTYLINSCLMARAVAETDLEIQRYSAGRHQSSIDWLVGYCLNCNQLIIDWLIFGATYDLLISSMKLLLTA